MECLKKTYLKYILLLVLFHSWIWIFGCEIQWTSIDWYRYWYYCFGYIIYFSILSSILILTQYALLYLCLITIFTLSIQYRILNKYIVMIVFISIFTINLSYNDVHFCLLKISFVFLQWFYIRHHLLIQIAMLIINY